MKFGPVTPEFKRGTGVYPLIDQRFSYVCLAAPLLDTAGSVQNFLSENIGAINRAYSILFHIFARGHHCNAARAIHARLSTMSLLEVFRKAFCLSRHKA